MNIEGMVVLRLHLELLRKSHEYMHKIKISISFASILSHH